MIGFSYKNFMLQIIQGGVILVFLIYLDILKCQGCSFNLGYNSLFSVLPFFCIAFIIGVMIDFFSDLFESFLIRIGVIKPPSYHLLAKGYRWGIVLSHHEKILEKLCQIAIDNCIISEKGLPIECTKESHNCKKNRKVQNYIFQVAKNKAFRKCKEYQRNQLESFFALYVFSRNISFSFIVGAILFLSFPTPSKHLMPNTDCVIALISILIISVLSSYRYFLYYARVMLGSTFKPSKENKC